MNLPVVAVVGRPNVGKSTLFNAIIRRRVAIEEPTAGVTRDRISSVVTHLERSFELLDTGGIGIEDSMGLSDEVEAQIQIALEQADLLVFVIDIKEGITPLDETVARKLRALELPVVFVANKCDSARDELSEGETYKLGLGQPLLCSAKQKYGRTDLLDAVVERLPPASGEEGQGTPEMKLAIVGKRNVGKSSLVNSLAKEERVIVSEVAGTTRDAIDVLFEVDGKKILAIDTAGVRKQSAIADSIEFFSLDRAKRSVRRADVVLLMLDCQADISKVDKQLAAEVTDAFKPCIIAVNKWDLAEGTSVDTYANYLRKTFKGFGFAPVSFVSAMTRLNVMQTMRLALELHEQARVRVGTGELNRAVSEMHTRRGPTVVGNRVGKIYYATQAYSEPPTIVLFVNDSKLFDQPYLRYLEGNLRKQFPFSEIPLKIVLRNAHGAARRKMERRREEEE